MEIDDLNRLGEGLLVELVRDPDGECARRFDALFYEPLWKYVRALRHHLGVRAARHLGLTGSIAPPILPDEVDEVAHEATVIALRRVRTNAARFDSNRGQPFSWLIGAVESAYVEVTKSLVEARRSPALRFVAPEELPEGDEVSPTTEEHVLRHIGDAEALADATTHLSRREYAALRLVVTLGYSYAEAARLIFGDSAMTKQVDGLLSRGKLKLAEAWQERRSTPRGAGGANLSDPMWETEGSDG